MPQLRQNVITGEWVVIAPERAKRPDEFVTAENVKREPIKNCVFCVNGKEYRRGNIKEFETDLIYVLPNKYPAFSQDKRHASPRTLLIEDDFYRMKPALGGNDIVVVKEHSTNLFQFSRRQWHDLFSVIKQRYLYWRNDRNSEYTMAIYNEGKRAGASIVHPHAQIFSSDIVVNQVVKELNGSDQYFKHNTRCVFCDLNDHERRQKSRIIFENDLFTAFTFYAARFPFESWVLPKEHASHFEHVSDRYLASLGETMHDLMAMYAKVLSNPPINFYIHDLPSSLVVSSHYHWHIEITPRITNYGGYELGSDVIIDVMNPEEAASFLRSSGHIK